MTTNYRVLGEQYFDWHAIIFVMLKQYIDMLIPWCSTSYYGWFSVYYPLFWRYLKISFCKCHNQIPLYPNLQLMTTVVQMPMKTLNNSLARPELEFSNWLTHQSTQLMEECSTSLQCSQQNACIVWMGYITSRISQF